MANSNLYQDIAARTGGDIYIGVVGPVRTGKSTFIKRFMEVLVIPNIEDPYRKERARDELPQSGSGKTIMTAEPKFVPEEAVEIKPDGAATLRVRMIDSVGYMVDGAMGAMEDGKPRMVTTPWMDVELPMTQAAEIGTRKVMEDHSSIGILVTTDGTITDIPRADYVQAEDRAITDMKATGKPFLVIVNSTNPKGEAAQSLCRELEARYGVVVVAADCQSMDQTQIGELLTYVLYAFPMAELRFYLPRWMDALSYSHGLKAGLYETIAQAAAGIEKISQAEPALAGISAIEGVQNCSIRSVELGTGTVNCVVEFAPTLFYQILSEQTGLNIRNDGDLMTLLTELSTVKKEYDKIAPALEEVKATGYGVVMPNPEEMHLDVPEIVRKGSTYGVKLKAAAPSIHMMRVDLNTEISPMVGDEKQSSELVNFLVGEYEGNTEKLWESNIFGKSVYEMISDGMNTKIHRLPMESRYKFKNSLARIINEGSNGLICIIL